MNKIKENKPFYIIKDLVARLEMVSDPTNQKGRKLIKRAKKYLDKHDTDLLRSLPWKPGHFAATAEEELACNLSNIDLTDESEETKQSRRVNLIQAHIRDFYREVEPGPSLVNRCLASLLCGAFFALGAAWGLPSFFRLFN